MLIRGSWSEKIPAIACDVAEDEDLTVRLSGRLSDDLHLRCQEPRMNAEHPGVEVDGLVVVVDDHYHELQKLFTRFILRR